MTKTEFNKSDAYGYMQIAHNVAESSSAHPDNKIASVLKLADGNVVASSNLWLHAFSPNYDSSVKVGRSSPTKHSEPAAITKASQQGLSTDGASLYITDPLCPNCMNAIVSAGVKDIYIEGDSFAGSSDWYNRRSYHFDSTSLQVAANAGVNVFKLKSDHEKQTAKAEQVKLPKPTQNIDFDEHYVLEEKIADNIDIQGLKSVLRTQFALQSKSQPKQRKALATFVIPSRDNKGMSKVLSVYDVPLVDKKDKNRLLGQAMDEVGVNAKRAKKELEKYQAKIFPLDHARSVLGRLGIEITKGTQIITTRIPTSHEVVNLCDVLDEVQLHVLDQRKTWMRDDKQALQVYRQAGFSLEHPPEERLSNSVLLGLDDGPHCSCC